MVVQITIIRYHFGQYNLSHETSGQSTFENFMHCENYEPQSKLYQQDIKCVYHTKGANS